MAENPSRHGRIFGRLRSIGAFYEVLILAAILWFLGKFIRYAFPPLFETLQEEYTVSTSEIGFAFSAFMVLYALLQFPSGVLADRFGASRVITGGAMVAALGGLLILIRPPFLLLVVAMAVIGAGTGAHKTVAVRLLSNVYPSRFGRTLGIFDTIGASGGVAAPLVVAGILGLAVLNWQLLFAMTAVAFLSAGFWFSHRTARTRVTQQTAANTGSVLQWDIYRDTFSSWKLIGFIGVTVLIAFAYNGLVAFLPLMLVIEGGLTPAVASLLYSVLFIASVTQLVTGEATDRFGPLRTAAVCVVCATAGLIGLVWMLTVGTDFDTSRGLMLLGGAVLAIGIGAHGYRPARDVYIVSLVPQATTGGSLGVVRTLLMMAGAVSPGLVGFTADQFTFLVAFTGLALIATVALLLIVILAITRSWNQ